MKFFEDVQLYEIPYRFSYRKITTDHYTGFYHCHQGMEFLYVHQGTGQIVVNGKVYTIQSDTFFYLQPYQLHHIQVEVHSYTPFERTIISFEPSIFEPYFTFFPQLNAYFQYLWKNELDEQGLYQAENNSFINQLFQHHSVGFSNSPLDTKQQNFALLLLQIFQFLYENGFGNPTENEFIPQRQLRYSEKILNWLEMHYSEEVSLDTLADHLHISKPYVSRIFKQETGATLMEYILARRVKQACLLLTTSNKGIEQISIEVGMNNFPYFCQAFKKVTGSTPMTYRRRFSNFS